MNEKPKSEDTPKLKTVLDISKNSENIYLKKIHHLLCKFTHDKLK